MIYIQHIWKIDKIQLDLRCLCNGKCCSNSALFLRAQLRSNTCNCALRDTVAEQQSPLCPSEDIFLMRLRLLSWSIFDMVLFRAPTKLSLVKCLAGPEINEKNINKSSIWVHNYFISKTFTSETRAVLTWRQFEVLCFETHISGIISGKSERDTEITSYSFLLNFWWSKLGKYKTNQIHQKI